MGLFSDKLAGMNITDSIQTVKAYNDLKYTVFTDNEIIKQIYEKNGYTVYLYQETPLATSKDTRGGYSLINNADNDRIKNDKGMYKRWLKGLVESKHETLLMDAFYYNERADWISWKISDESPKTTVTAYKNLHSRM